MATMLVRLKPYVPRRGHVLRRFTYRGIKFLEERGWYRVEKNVAEYLRDVRQIATDEHSPPAFDVLTEKEAKALDKKEKEEQNTRKSATDNIRLSTARRDGVGTADEPAEAERDNKGASERPAEKQ